MSPKVRLCAYCGKPGVRSEMTQEHFVPKCLWEGRRPNRTLTVWVHLACNAGYSKDDEFFRTALIAMHGTERHSEAVNVLNGTMSRFIKNRPHLFFKHLPNLDFRPLESAAGLYLGKALTFSLNIRRFFRILRKVVLGLYYNKMGKPLAADFDVNLVWENRYTSPVLEPMIRFMSPICSFGDDVFIYAWFQDPRDDRRTYWCLAFYKAVSFFAATCPMSEQPVKGGALHFLNVSPMSVWPRL